MEGTEFIARGVYQGVFLGSTPVDGKETFRPREWSCSARVTASASPVGGSRAEMAHQSCPTNARPFYFHHICILAAGPRKEKEEGKASPIRA